jgi:hypothetical protein
MAIAGATVIAAACIGGAFAITNGKSPSEGTEIAKADQPDASKAPALPAVPRVKPSGSSDLDRVGRALATSEQLEREKKEDEALLALDTAIEMIKAHPGRRILVAGYTDNVGKPDFNLKLSIARAGAVRDWLMDAADIPVTQFAIQGYGDTRPIGDNETAEGRAMNRRVEITLVPDADRKPAGT